MTRQTRVAGRGAGTWLALVFLAGIGLGTAVPGGVAAQGVLDGDTDDRWLAWLGCWQPVEDAETAPRPRTTGAGDPGGLVCFQPLAGDLGVERVQFEGGAIVARQTIRADGRRHDANVEGCEGWERGDFSRRAGRVFFASEHVCDGGVARASTGVLTLVSPEEWIDVRVLTAGSESTTWVTRHRLATEEEAAAAGFGGLAAERAWAVHAARTAGSARPTVDDVIEAVRYVDSEGVGAWIAERDTPLELGADELVRMADAGVSEEVIDMTIAVSYPSRFAVEREPAAESRGPRYARTYGGFGHWGYYDPYYGSLFYSPYGFYSGYYSPYRYGYGYSYGFRGGYRGFYVPTVISVDGADRGGRVINRRGYQQSRGSSWTRGRSSQRGSVGSSGRSSRGTSTGRTAKRRGGGGT